MLWDRGNFLGTLAPPKLRVLRTRGRSQALGATVNQQLFVGDVFRFMAQIQPRRSMFLLTICVRSVVVRKLPRQTLLFLTQTRLSFSF